MIRSAKHWSVKALVVVTAAVLVGWNLSFGFRQFGGDGSVLLNAAWLQYTGYAAYSDFKTACPPLFLFPLDWAFRIGGVSWASTVHLLTAFSLLIYCWQFTLFRRAGASVAYAVAASFVLQAVTLLTSSWWWYNPLTGIVEAMLVASTIFLTWRPGDGVFRASLIAALFLVALAKINTAVPLLGAVGLLLFARRETRLFGVMAGLGTALAVTLLFFVEGTSPLLYLQNVQAAAARSFSPPMWRMCFYGIGATDFQMTIFGVILLIPILALIIIDRTGSIPNHRERRAARAHHFYLALVVVGLFVAGGTTNNDLKMIDAAGLIMAVLCYGATFAPGTTSLRDWFVRASVILILGSLALDGLIMGWSRQRVLNMGNGQFWESGQLVTLEQPPALRGMVTGLRFPHMVEESVDALEKLGALHNPNKKVFIGFRIDCLYPVLGIHQPRGLPLWWENVPSSHLGDDYSTNSNLPAYWDQPARWLRPGEPFDPRTQAFLDAKFDVCLFWRGYLGRADMAYFPSEIRADLHDHYTVDDHYSLIVVYRRKD